MEDDMMVYHLIEDMVLGGAKCSERSIISCCQHQLVGNQ
jgi:hypothetical protein